MVVARKTESKPSPANESVEDLLIISVSETESVDGDTYTVPRSTQKRLGNCALVTSSSVVYTKGCGKRKRRQYENFVDLLSKGPVEFCIPTIHDFLPMGHRSLLSLLEECSIFEAFCYGCEDFLEKLGGNFGRYEKEGQGRWRSIKSFGINASSLPLMSSDQILLEKKSLLRVEESVRSALISGEISQDLVKDLEDKLVNFFISNPRETFMSRGLSSLQRMALCAICNFHLLLYKCYRKRRYHVVQVQNSNYVFDVPSVHLSTVLLKYQNSGNDEIVKL